MSVEMKEKIFNRNVDKEQIPVCNILGVDIAAINMEWLLEFINKNVERLSGDYMCVANVHTTVTAFEDNQYRDIQNGGIMAIPDGGPLSSLGRKRGYSNMGRTTGPSLLEEILSISAEKGYKHYFYGATKDTLERLEVVLQEKYPEVEVVGMYSPPFRPLTAEEDSVCVSNINDVVPDFVWVGLGAPKQEKWMADHQGSVHGLMIGVGAAFDYLAGNIQRAPMWMQKNNLEWLYRLVQEPRRLFKRYIITNTKFIWYACVRKL